MVNYGMELAMVLNVSPILGPSKRTTLITTSATNARMIAYSTSPCPLSFGANNMRKFLSLKNMSEISDYTHDITKYGKLQPVVLAHFVTIYAKLTCIH